MRNSVVSNIAEHITLIKWRVFAVLALPFFLLEDGFNFHFPLSFRKFFNVESTQCPNSNKLAIFGIQFCLIFKTVYSDIKNNLLHIRYKYYCAICVNV